MSDQANQSNPFPPLPPSAGAAAGGSGNRQPDAAVQQTAAAQSELAELAELAEWPTWMPTCMDEPLPVDEANLSLPLTIEQGELAPAELTALAQSHFANAFPLTAPEHCPPPATLAALIQSGELPDAAVRAHLFGCSHCFTFYRAALRERTSAGPVSDAEFGKARPSIWQTGRAAWAELWATRWPQISFGVLCALLALGWLSWAGLVRPASPPAPAINAGLSEPPAQASVPVERDAAPSPQLAPADQLAQLAAPTQRSATAQPSKPAQPSTLENVTVRLDLADYVLLRDLNAAQPGQRLITLKRALTRLRLLLPEGSVPGRYTLQFRPLDVAAAPLKPLKVEAVSPDGLHLNLQLDLRQVTATRGELILQYANESPDHYQVRLTK